MITRSEYIKVFLLRTFGNFFLLSAVAGVILTLAPAAEAEFIYRYNELFAQEYFVVGDENPCEIEPVYLEEDNIIRQGGTIKCKDVEEVTDPGLLGLNEPLAIEPADPEFSVVIPKIGANARVIANVDAGNYQGYIEALKLGVAHAEGTVYPGQVGNSFLFAHSVGNFWEVNRWNAVFYLLRELEPGDEVNVFYKGERYIYQVYEKRVVGPSDVSYLSARADFPKLTLQTCWPPGTTLQRLLVFARLKSE